MRASTPVLSLPVVQMVFNDSLPSGAASAGEAGVASLSSLKTAGVLVLAEGSSEIAGTWDRDLTIGLFTTARKSTFLGFFLSESWLFLRI